MSERQPYSRVYWSIRTDPKFDAVYGDDRHLAAWLRLLIAADATWPAPADVPATARKASLRALAEAQLIDLLPSGMFKIRGLDAERGRRRDAAQTGAGSRWGRDANGIQTDSERSPNGMLAKPSLAEDETSLAESPRDPAVVYANVTGSWPSNGAVDWIDRLTSEYGPDAVIKATGKARAPRGQLISAIQDILRAEARQLSKAQKAVAEAEVAEKRQNGMLSRRLDYYHSTGKWPAEWGDPPVAA